MVTSMDGDGDGADAEGDDDKLDEEFVLLLPFVYNFDTYSLGVVRPSVESGLGQFRSGHIGELPRLNTILLRFHLVSYILCRITFQCAFS